MEKDDEVKGGGNSYDFGARMYDARVGRWWSGDKLEKKFPSETTYGFVGQNPIIAFDKNGDEKIVVSGGADMHNKNRFNFTMAAKNQIREYKKAIKNAKSNETITWLILDVDYTNAEKKSFDLWAKNNGVNPPIYINTAADVSNYINSKNTADKNLTSERTLDPISNLSFMSHGVTSLIVLNYANSNWTGYFDDVGVFDQTDISNLNPNAFECSSSIDMYSCNSATPESMSAKDYSSNAELINDAMTGNNLVKSFSVQIPDSKVSGFIGQTSYKKVLEGELPGSATMGGSYSPTVNGTSPKTLKVEMKNGKVENN